MYVSMYACLPVFLLDQVLCLRVSVACSVLSVYFVCLLVFHPSVRLPDCVFVCLSGFLCVCLSIYLSIRLLICLPVCLSIYIRVCLSVCLYVCLYVCLSGFLSVCLCIYLSIRPSICLSIRLSICVSKCICQCVYRSRSAATVYPSPLISQSSSDPLNPLPRPGIQTPSAEMRQASTDTISRAVG